MCPFSEPFSQFSSVTVKKRRGNQGKNGIKKTRTLPICALKSLLQGSLASVNHLDALTLSLPSFLFQMYIGGKLAKLHNSTVLFTAKSLSMRFFDKHRTFIPHPLRGPAIVALSAKARHLKAASK
jgi:hypothetical protein